MAGFTPMDAGYILVAERHAQFVKDYPDGRIETDLIANHFDPESGKGLVIVRARVWKSKTSPDDSMYLPDGTGMSSMPIPGPTSFTRNSEVENAETSAVGRALAMIGYHAKETMASEDEIAMKSEKSGDVFVPGPLFPAGPDDRPATPAQLVKLMAWGKKLLPDEKAVRSLVFRETGKRKRADLTRDDITKLFDLFKVIESTGGTVEMEGVE